MGARRDVTIPRPALSAIEFDTFSVALGLAVVTGGLALLASFLESLTTALVALSVAGWAAGLSGSGRPRGALTHPRRMGGIVLAGIGAATFFWMPGPLDASRGLVLALSLVPLWLIERRGIPRRPSAPVEVP